MIYTHSGGVEGIAMDLYKMLSEDLSVRLDLERYNGIKGERQEARQEMRQNIAVQTEGIETKRENIHSAAGEPAKAKRENSASVAEERTEVKKKADCRMQVQRTGQKGKQTVCSRKYKP